MFVDLYESQLLVAVLFIGWLTLMVVLPIATAALYYASPDTLFWGFEYLVTSCNTLYDYNIHIRIHANYTFSRFYSCCSVLYLNGLSHRVSHTSWVDVQGSVLYTVFLVIVSLLIMKLVCMLFCYCLFWFQHTLCTFVCLSNYHTSTGLFTGVHVDG